MHRTQVVAAGARTMGSLHPTLLHATPFALVFLLCACVAPGPTREGDVQIAPVQPDDAPTFTLGSNQRFIFGRPIADQRTMPVYPASALAARLPPLSVCVELETDEEGRVTAARPLDLAGSCAPAADPVHAAAFRQAVHAAVMTWRYLPSLLCTGVAFDQPQEPDSCGSASAQAVPLLRAYRFVFTQREGQPSVGVGVVPTR